MSECQYKSEAVFQKYRVNSGPQAPFPKETDKIMQDQGSSIIICLGANLPSSVGEPYVTCRSAVEKLPKSGIFPTAISRYFATPCFPAGAGPDYVNAALAARTRLSPRDVLDRLHAIEAAFGRNRMTRWGQRTLDLDLIAYDDLVTPDHDTQAEWMAMPADRQKLAAPDRLILPHPRLQDRAFVLVPMHDVAPDWRHPVLDLNVSDMLKNLESAEISAVKPL